MTNKSYPKIFAEYTLTAKHMQASGMQIYESREFFSKTVWEQIINESQTISNLRFSARFVFTFNLMNTAMGERLRRFFHSTTLVESFLEVTSVNIALRDKHRALYYALLRLMVLIEKSDDVNASAIIKSTVDTTVNSTKVVNVYVNQTFILTDNIACELLNHVLNELDLIDKTMMATVERQESIKSLDMERLDIEKQIRNLQLDLESVENRLQQLKNEAPARYLQPDFQHLMLDFNNEYDGEDNLNDARTYCHDDEFDEFIDNLDDNWLEDPDYDV